MNQKEIQTKSENISPKNMPNSQTRIQQRISLFKAENSKALSEYYEREVYLINKEKKRILNASGEKNYTLEIF